jgi:hypothetical protein
VALALAQMGLREEKVMVQAVVVAEARAQQVGAALKDSFMLSGTNATPLTKSSKKLTI